MHSRGLLFLSVALLTACASTGMINQPPRATSAQSAVDVRVHNVISDSHVTFMIDDVEIYGFVEPSHYDFVIDAGGYRFGYKQNVVAKSNEHYGIPGRRFATNESKAKTLNSEQLDKVRDEHVRMSRELKCAATS